MQRSVYISRDQREERDAMKISLLARF